ncbi:MAG: restriction endonuclease subunit S [Rhodobacteraceae bacterium]|nr:restriction endonuclease subunit S [Paracoccaceae bacterium]
MSWETKTVADLGKVVTGKTPSTSNRDFYDGDFLFVTPTDLDWQSYYVNATHSSVTQLAKDKHKNQFIPQGSTTFTCIGNTIGKCGITSDICLTNQQINSIVPNEEHDPRFVYYLMNYNRDKVRSIGLSGGAAQPIINKTTFSRVEVSVPNLPTQERIAAILSAYDDLIENNRRRIALLEQAARLLYREWFVHFRFPGHETAKFVDGLPEGWKSGTILDLFDTSSGGTPSRKNAGFYDGSINWLKTQELKNCFIFETGETISESALKLSSAKLFPENTVIIAMYGATIGQLGLLAQPASTNQACCALLPKRDGRDYLFGYCLMEHSTRMLKDLGQGSAQNNVSQTVIKGMEFVVPAPDVLDEFNASVEPNFLQRKNLQAQNANLTRARDLLLPRLMDGRIPI